MASVYVEPMHASWRAALSEEFKKPYFRELAAFVENEREQHVIYPPKGEVFTALDATTYEGTSVVILGQDPYHGPGQAHGLSFSVKRGMPLPPSLQNIYRELRDDVGFSPPGHGCLLDWAQRGVLLLNTVLTVRERQAGSHQGMGWETFTDAIIRKLDERDRPVVFVFWGAHARQKRILIDEAKHIVVDSAHPSPMSATRGFFGSRPFSQVNEALRAAGLPEVEWQIRAEG